MSDPNWLELETQSEAAAGFHLSLQGMDDFGEEEEEIGPEGYIRILVAKVPGKLDSGPSVESKENNLFWKHVDGPGLKFQVADR